MIIPLPPANLHLPLPSSLFGGFFEILGQELSVLVKLVARPVIDLDRHFFVFGKGGEEEGAIVFLALGRGGGEVALEGFLTPLTFGRVATGDRGRHRSGQSRYHGRRRQRGDIPDRSEPADRLVLARVFQVKR